MHYSVSCQYAHHQHEESTDLGVMNAVDALRTFDDFKWSEQLEEANHLQKCSPTVSIKAGERLIWVSVYGAPAAPTFVSECSFPGVKKKLFGLMQVRGTVNLHADELTFEQSRTAVELFLNGDEDALRSLYGGG